MEPRVQPVRVPHPHAVGPRPAQRRLLHRPGTPELRTAAATTVLAAGYPLVYLRGDRHLVVVNPFGTTRTADIPSLKARTTRPLEASGTAVTGGHVETAAFGYGIFALGAP